MRMPPTLSQRTSSIPAIPKASNRRGEEATKAGDDGVGKEPKADKIAAFPMAMSAVAGLVLFLFGVTQLAQGLGHLNSERMRRVLSKFTTNRLAAREPAS